MDDLYCRLISWLSMILVRKLDLPRLCILLSTVLMQIVPNLTIARSPLLCIFTLMMIHVPLGLHLWWIYESIGQLLLNNDISAASRRWRCQVNLQFRHFYLCSVGGSLVSINLYSRHGYDVWVTTCLDCSLLLLLLGVVVNLILSWQGGQVLLCCCMGELGVLQSTFVGVQVTCLRMVVRGRGGVTRLQSGWHVQVRMRAGWRLGCLLARGILRLLLWGLDCCFQGALWLTGLHSCGWSWSWPLLSSGSIPSAFFLAWMVFLLHEWCFGGGLVIPHLSA